MDQVHPVDYLFERMKAFEPYYPLGVAPVPQLISGTAFFPGGPGLWGVRPGTSWPSMPVGGVMVLGHNFDKKSGYEYSLKHLGENLNGSTWRYLVLLLDQAGIPKNRCFFTNFYMGLVDGASAVGPFPGKRSSDFVRRCQEFMGEQFRVMQPKIVLVLGKEFFNEFAIFLPEEFQARSVWMRAKTWQDIDQQDVGLIYPVTLPELLHPVVVVALVHPSYRFGNVRFRRYRNLAGEAAELGMLQDALEKAGPI